MSQDDYIILFDEDGSPYIAHAGLDGLRNFASNAASTVSNAVKGVGRGVRQNHKYILKVFENGRNRYFYKQEEVKAYYDAKRKGIKNPAEYAQKAAEKASNFTKSADNAIREGSRQLSKGGTEAVDKLRSASDKAADSVKDAASSTFNQVKNAANNAVSNAKTQYDRMRNEFRERTGINLKERAQTAEKEAQDAEAERRKAAGKFSSDVDRDLASRKALDENPNSAHAQAERDQAVAAVRKSGEEYYKEGGALDTAQKARDEAAKAREEYNDFKDAHSPKAMIDKARTTVKDTADKASDSAKDMLDKARTAVKDTAEKASDSVKGMIDKARDAVKDATTPKTEKSEYGEYDPKDTDFDDKNYSDANHVKDTDFYTFKRDDGRWVVLEEDMKWVLPEGVRGDSPEMAEALTKFDRKMEQRRNNGERYTADEWSKDATKAIDAASQNTAGRVKNAVDTAVNTVKDTADKARDAVKDIADKAQSSLDNYTGNDYRKRAEQANEASENAINQRSRTSDQLENQRSKYGTQTNDAEHIYGDSEGYYYKTEAQRDRAEALIKKRDQYDADIVNNNASAKFNDRMYADSKAGKIDALLGRTRTATSERSNANAAEVQNKWDRQEAEDKLIGGRLDPDINVSKEYVYSRASNSGMAGQVQQVMQLEEDMRNAKRAFERLGEDTSKPQSSSRAARQKMVNAQKAYEKAYEELIDDINEKYDQDLADYEKKYGKYNGR